MQRDTAWSSQMTTVYREDDETQTHKLCWEDTAELSLGTQAHPAPYVADTEPQLKHSVGYSYNLVPTPRTCGFKYTPRAKQLRPLSPAQG